MSESYDCCGEKEVFEEEIKKFHPSHQQVLKYFAYWHLPDHLKHRSERFCRLAFDCVNQGGDGIEITVGLRKLLEAKDAFVRAKV